MACKRLAKAEIASAPVSIRRTLGSDVTGAQGKAGCRHRADFGECPLLGDEPPFLPGTNSPLEKLHSRVNIFGGDVCRDLNTVVRFLKFCVMPYAVGTPKGGGAYAMRSALVVKLRCLEPACKP